MDFMRRNRFKSTLPLLLLALVWGAAAWGAVNPGLDDEIVEGRWADAGTEGLATGRVDFPRAERLLKQGDQPGYEPLRDRLRDYPLYPYLRFAELGDLKTAADTAMAAFLSEFPDTPLAERVRAAYVKRLAQEERWAELARVSREADEAAERRCLYLRALSETGAADQTLTAERLEPLWLVGQSQPAACDPLFTAWRARGGLDNDLIWRRIRLALEADEVGLARHLKTWLPATEQIGVDRWLAIRERPALVLEPLSATTASSPLTIQAPSPRPSPARGEGAGSSAICAAAASPGSRGCERLPFPQAAAMLADGIARLARSQTIQTKRTNQSQSTQTHQISQTTQANQANPANPAYQAATALEVHRAILATDAAAWDHAHAAVGQALIPSDVALGLAIWDCLGERDDNLEAQERRLRAAIGQRDWARIADWVRRMPDREEKRDRWLYWQARAEAALGQEQAAQATFAAAARQRSLWGLLAADRLGLPYPLDSRPVPVEPARLQRLAALPALDRIRELGHLGREADQRREWRTLTRDLAVPDLQAAALLATGLDWHDQAILTLARTDYWDDLELRFPLAYRELVEDQAWQTGLPADWIFGVIRQESVFNPDIASEAGALGLMQLMPGTAKDLAAEAGDPAPGRAAILAPARNIDLGSRYLARMRDRFGHAALATAAYNAGPNRVARWLPDRCTEADLWITTIPYAETRGYVERVLAYRVIYQRRLGLEPVRLSDLLPPIPAG